MDKRAFVIIVLIVALVGFWMIFKHSDYTKQSVDIDSIMTKLLLKTGITNDHISKELTQQSFKNNKEFLRIEKEYFLPSKVDLKNLKDAISKTFKTTNYKILKSDLSKTSERQELNITIAFKGLSIYSVRFVKRVMHKPLSIAEESKKIKEIKSSPKAKAPKIAIILDDFGYSTRNLTNLSAIKYPLTLAILPNLNYSKKVAEWGVNHNFEIILHLPLEPNEKTTGLEVNTILTSWDSARIKKILRADLDSMPGLKGVSNHMGSKATETEATMKAIFEELKARRLFYLDSLATNKTICQALAKKLNLGYAKRDIFIDNDSDPDYIKGQLNKLFDEANSLGVSVGIGHDRPNTIAVLKEVMPAMAKNGIEFIYVSDIVK